MLLLSKHEIKSVEANFVHKTLILIGDDVEVYRHDGSLLPIGRASSSGGRRPLGALVSPRYS